MGAGEMEMKEKISMTETECSVLNEVLKYHECGWPNNLRQTFTTPSILVLEDV
jgi:hypothetical protein